MITKRVELPATAASARREREGKPQAAQQENTKQGAGYGNVLRVGVTSKARAAKGPAWDSSSAREAGVRSERCISYARLSQAWAASRCQPLNGQRSRSTAGLSGRGAGLADHSGASKPQSHRCCRARIAAVAQGKTPSPRSAFYLLPRQWRKPYALYWYSGILRNQPRKC